MDFRKGRRRIVLAVLSAMLLVLFALPPSMASEESNQLRMVTAIDQSMTLDHILHYALEKMGYRMSVDVTAMTYAIQMANSGEVDGLVNQLRDLTKSHPNLVRVKEPIGYVSYGFFTGENSKLSLNGWEALQGLKVGVLFQKATAIERLNSVNAIVMEYQNMQALNQALLDGRIDVFIASLYTGQEIFLMDGVMLAYRTVDEPTYTHLNKRYAHLVPQLEQSLRDMRSSGVYRSIIEGTYKGDKGKTVLHISSYAPDDIWDDALSNAIKTELEANADVTYYNVPLYSKRYASDYERAKNALPIIRTLFADRSPDLIMITDNDALTFILDYSYGLFVGIPVVYCAVAGDESVTASLPAEFVGVRESLDFSANLDMIAQLLPSTERVLFLSNDTPGAQLVREDMRKQAEDYDKLTVSFEHEKDFKALLAQLSALEAGTVVFIGDYASSTQFDGMSLQKVHRAICDAANVPVFCGLTVGDGELGGKQTDAALQAHAACQYALALLGGTQIDELPAPPDTKELSVWRFDQKQLDKYGIERSDLPADAQVINSPLSMLDNNPYAVPTLILGLLLITATIVVVIIFVRKIRYKNDMLKNAEQSILATKTELEKNRQLSVDKAKLDDLMAISNAGVFEMDLQGGTITFDETYRDLFEYRGLSLTVPLRDWEDHLKTHMRAKDFAMVLDMLRQRDDSQWSKLTQLAIYRPDRTLRYVKNSMRNVYDQKGQMIGLQGICMDITAEVVRKEQRSQMAQTLLDSLDEMVFVADLYTDEILFVNAAMKKAFNLDQSCVGRPCYEALAGKNKPCSYCINHLFRDDHNVVLRNEHLQSTLNKVVRHMQKCIPWGEGKLALFHSYTDINDEKKAERAIEERYRQQELIAGITKDLIGMDDLDAVLHASLTRAGTYIECDRMMIAERRGDALVPVSEWVSEDAPDGEKRKQHAPLAPSELFYEAFIVQQMPYVVANTQFNAPVRVREDTTVNSILAVPLQTDGEFAGLLELGSCTENYRWTASQIQLATMLAGIYTMFLSRQRIATELTNAKETAERANSDKSAFMANMNNDIRIPMNEIIALTQATMRQELPPEAQKNLQGISDASQELMEILNKTQK